MSAKIINSGNESCEKGGASFCNIPYDPAELDGSRRNPGIIFPPTGSSAASARPASTAWPAFCTPPDCNCAHATQPEPITAIQNPRVLLLVNPFPFRTNT